MPGPGPWLLSSLGHSKSLCGSQLLASQVQLGKLLAFQSIIELSIWENAMGSLSLIPSFSTTWGLTRHQVYLESNKAIRVPFTPEYTKVSTLAIRDDGATSHQVIFSFAVVLIKDWSHLDRGGVSSPYCMEGRTLLPTALHEFSLLVEFWSRCEAFGSLAFLLSTGKAATKVLMRFSSSGCKCPPSLPPLGAAHLSAGWWGQVSCLV